MATQTAMWADEGERQLDLSNRVRAGDLPQQIPAADVELAEAFLKAALAWSRWKERRSWGGR